MRKVLVLVAILAGLNAFGASCNLEKLRANANELQLLYYYGTGEGDSFSASLTELAYVVNDYAFRCSGDFATYCIPKIKAKHKKNFTSKGLEWNITNIRSQLDKANDEIDACELAQKNAKMKSVLD